MARGTAELEATAAVEVVVAPDEASAELRAAALREFTPLTFAITSSTPDMVNVEAIIDFIRRDDAFANVLFIVEAMRASTRDGPAAKAGGGGGSARQRGSAGAKHAPPEGAKSSATALRAEYVRIAEDREKERRRLIEEREKELDALRVQYVEDGMTEEEAAKAAEEDMREMEEAQMDDEDEDADDRKPLFFCVRDFPHTLEDVVESNRAELPLHVLVDVRSNIPLIGSTGYVLREQADTKTTNNAKDAHRMRAPSKHSRGVEEHSIAQLPQLLLERQETRVVTDYGPLDEVFVCRYDFPVETIPSMVSPEAPPTYRATMTEKAAFAQVRDVLLQLEEHLFRYREWRNRRAVLPVPAYAPLPNPDAPKLPPVEEVDEKRPPSRSRSRSQGGKKNAAVKVEEVVSIIPQTTAPNPATMAEVAAHQERYDAFLREHRKSVAHVDVRAFVEACKAQLSATEPQNLLTKAQLDEKAMQLHREGVERFAHYVFDRVMGPLPPPKPAATTTDMPIKASGATLSPALLARMSKAKTAAPTTTTNTQAAPAVQFVTAPTDAAAPAGDPAGAADAAAPPPPKLLTPEEEAAAEAEVAQRLAPAPLSEVDAEQLSQVVAVVVGELSPELNPDVARQLTAQLMSYLLVSLDGQSDPIVAQFLRYKNRKAWRENEVVWGPHRLHVFSRGDGSTRTQHSAYSFEGPTTFPEYISQIHFCEGEGLYFYPPPPDSDADEPEMDEAEESEEDEEDEEGNIIPRKRKEPEPLPHIDHVTVVQRAMRRRRVYEEIRSYATRPCLQELMCMGRGARGAVEEVEWMLPADGCLIEVERSVANTLQLACSVLPLRGLDCGFFYTPETESDVVADHVPSRVRSYVALGREVQLFSEVVADNRVAAELAAYEAAVVAAKAEAKTQFESLNVRTRSGRSKDKNAPPPPTLAGLEEACIKAIPVPKQRSRCLPSLHLSAVVNEGACSLVYHEEHSMLEVVQNFPVNHVELTLRVWRGGAVDRIHLSSIRKVLLYTSGMMEVVSDDAEGYRILLGSRGSYLTSKDDTCLSISEAGDCVVRTRRQVVRLAPLKRSTCVDASSKCQRQSSLREDGMVSVMEQQALVSVKYSDSVAVRWEDGECRWSVRGLPDLVSCASTTAQYLGLDCGQSGQLRFDLVAHTAVLSFAHDDFRAHYDFVEYQLHVRPSSAVSFYTIDCAFGGLHASLQVPEEVVYRVSPHGRCSEERGGLVVTPPTYTTPEAQPLLRYREVLSQRFLEALTDTEVLLDRDALHRMESFSTELAMPAIAITSGADASVARPAIAGKSLMEAQCTSQAIAAVDSLLHLKTAPRRCLLAATVSPSTGLAGPITLAEPAMARILSEEWCRRVHPLRTCPRRVEEGSSVLREDLLALSPANTSAAQTLGKSSLPRRTGAVGTREDPSTSDSAVAAAAASGPCVEWYLVCQPNNAPTENPAPIGQDFFTAELQTDRVKRLVAEATADIEKTLPLSLRAEKVEAAAPTPSIPDEEVAAAAAATAATDLDVSHPTATALSDLPDGVSVDDAPTTAAPLIDHRLNYWASCHAPEKVVPLNPIPRREQPEPKRPRTKAPAPHPLRVAADEDAPIPLMLSHLTPADSALGNNDTGTTAATRGHAPNLLLQPSVVDFGTVKTRRRYGVVAQLTNPSTVPCRYRCVVAAGAKGVVSLRYPRHFIAPGLTEGIEVRLSGMQPIGPMEATILVRHEGGSSKLTARWTTTEDEEKVRLQPAAFCLGTSLAPFVPGVSLRLTNRRDSDLYEESVHESNASSDDDDDAPPLSCI